SKKLLFIGAFFISTFVCLYKPHHAMNHEKIFSITSSAQFEGVALEIFRYQYEKIEVYRNFCKFLKTEPGKIKEINDIPFLPIEFFKSHEIFPGDMTSQVVFTSSGTTG